MSKLKIHAGDFPKTVNVLVAGNHNMSFIDPVGGGFFGKTYTYPKYEIESIEMADEESVIRIGSAVGWGVAGSVPLGSAGLLAGVLLGGCGKGVTFVAHFKDGKKMLATTDAKSFAKLQALVL